MSDQTIDESIDDRPATPEPFVGTPSTVNVLRMTDGYFFATLDDGGYRIGKIDGVCKDYAKGQLQDDEIRHLNTSGNLFAQAAQMMLDNPD